MAMSDTVPDGQVSQTCDWPVSKLIEHGANWAKSSSGSAADVLETARQGIARTVGTTIDLRLPSVPGTWLIAGRGPLAQDLSERLVELRPGMRLLHEPDIRLSPGSLEPAAAAVLALFCFDQTPATHPALTGALRPRVLGRITPGSPQAWFRLCRELSSARPVVTLRSAM